MNAEDSIAPVKTGPARSAEVGDTIRHVRFLNPDFPKSEARRTTTGRVTMVTETRVFYSCFQPACYCKRLVTSHSYAGHAVWRTWTNWELIAR